MSIKEFTGTITNDNTREAYKYALTGFLEYLNNKNAKNASSEDLNNYLEKKRSQGVSERSLAVHYTAISAYYRFLRKPLVLRGVNFPSYSKSLPDFISKKEVETFLGSFSLETKYEVRDTILFGLLYYNGLKLSEALNILCSDVTINNVEEQVTIYVSDRCSFIKVIEPTIIKCINLYFNVYRQEFAKNESPCVFITNKSGRLARKAVWALAQKYVERNNLSFHVTPDILRNSFIVHQILEGVPTRKIISSANIAEDTNFKRYLIAANNERG